MYIHFMNNIALLASEVFNLSDGNGEFEMSHSFKSLIRKIQSQEQEQGQECGCTFP